MQRDLAKAIKKLAMLSSFFENRASLHAESITWACASAEFDRYSLWRRFRLFARDLLPVIKSFKPKLGYLCLVSNTG